jgi:hypothetical protein
MSLNLSEQTAVSQIKSAGDLYARSNLTRMQLLCWTGQQLRLDIPLYAAPMAFIITGTSDAEAGRALLAAKII